MPSLFAVPPKTEKRRKEAQEVARFVRELYAASGFKSWGEFARAVGVAPATMSDYQRAENAVGGYLLLKMIRAAQWKAAEQKPGLVDRLPAIEEKVDEALTGISDVLDLLRGAPGQSDAGAPGGTRQ